MKPLFVLILLLLSVVNAAEFTSIASIDSEIQRLRSVLSANRPVPNEERQLLLNSVLKWGHITQLKMILNDIFVEPHVLWEHAEPIKASVLFNFQNPIKIEMAKMALHDLTEKGFEMQVRIEGYKHMDIGRDSIVLDELQSLGYLDVNEAMLQSARYGRIDLVYHFISRGADINYEPESQSSTSNVLYNVVARPEYYDFNCFQSLLNAGARPDLNRNNLILSTAIAHGRHDIARVLMNQRVPCSTVWEQLIFKKNWNLIPEALKNGYEPSSYTRSKIIKDAIGAHDFKLAKLLLECPFEGSNFLYFNYLALVNNIDRSKTSDPRLIEDFNSLEEFLNEKINQIQAEKNKK